MLEELLLKTLNEYIELKGIKTFKEKELFETLLELESFSYNSKKELIEYILQLK